MEGTGFLEQAAGALSAATKAMSNVTKFVESVQLSPDKSHQRAIELAAAAHRAETARLQDKLQHSTSAIARCEEVIAQHQESMKHLESDLIREQTHKEEVEKERQDGERQRARKDEETAVQLATLKAAGGASHSRRCPSTARRKWCKV